MTLPSFLAKALSVLLLTTSACAWAAPVLDDSAFRKGLKPEVPLKDCKKRDGVVQTVASVTVWVNGGWFNVFVSDHDTPEGVSAGKYRVRPSQHQLDSLIGQKYCYVS